MRCLCGTRLFCAAAIVGLGLIVLATGVARADLVQYWEFDDGGGTTATNSVVSGLAGTLMTGDGDTGVNVNAAPTWSTDKPGVLAHSSGSLQFENTLNEWVDVGPLGLLSSWEATSGHGVTVAMWIKPGDSLHVTQLYDWTDEGTGSLGYQNGGARLANGNSGSDPAQMWLMGRNSANSGYAWYTLSPSGAVVTDQWQHVAVTHIGKAVYLYIDGQLTHYANLYTAFTFDTAGFGIGCKRRVKSTSNSQNCFDGLIDDVAIWDKALTPDAVAQLAAGADPTSIVERPAQPSYDQVLSVDIIHNNPSYNPLPTYTGRAAIGAAGTTWNEPVVEQDTETGNWGFSLTDAIDSDGDATSIDVSFSNFGSVWQDGSGDRPPHPMFGDRINAQPDTTNNWQIDGLEIGQVYDIYFYGYVAGQFDVTSGGTGSAQLLCDSGSPAFCCQEDAPEDWVEGIHYAVLRVTPTASTMTGTITPLDITSATNGVAMAGLQIAHVVPEPSSLMGLVALACAALAVRLQRR